MFKKRDKVRCINASGEKYITVGAVYRVIGICTTAPVILIEDDADHHSYCEASRFELVSEEDNSTKYKAGEAEMRAVELLLALGYTVKKGE